MILYDECVSILFKDDIKLVKSGLRVVEHLGQGTKDPIIEYYADKFGLTIATLDRGLFYNQLKKKRIVNVVNRRSGEILEVRVRCIGKLEPKHDPVTQYFKMCSNHEVIRP